MRLGFVGTGEITSAIVTGLCSPGLSSPGADGYCIQLSPRNLEIATHLADRFPGVSVASSNQDVLDSSETVVIAVRPATDQTVLSELRFRSDHCVISLVSGLSLRPVSELVAPASRVIRAVPLPSTARRIGPTAIYPADRIAADLFAAIGTVFPVETEAEFVAICAATATIASFYAFVEGIASWLRTNSLSDETARNYVARMFFGLTSAAVHAPERSFQSLARSHATAGGINEQFLRHMSDCGLLENISAGLDAVMERMK